MSLLKDKIELDIQEAELQTQKTFSGLPGPVRWFLIIAIIGIIPAYFISKAVSEKIWLSRYSTDIITAKQSFENPQAPQVSPVTVTTFAAGQYAAAVKITNPNLNLSLDKVPYSFNFYNAQNQQVYSYKDTLYLLPNQTKYITAPTFSPSDTIASAGFQLPQTLPWQNRLDIPKVTLITSLPNSYEQASPPGFVVQGDYTNQSPYQLQTVRLTFVLFGVSGKIIGLSQRDDFTLAPFERRSYTQIWPNVSGVNVSKVEVDANTDVLDSPNLTAPAVNQNSASDLSRPAVKPY